mmetsp:Transcript_46264/g.107590  ORF Transcript_46264/g.107590 Transcript_46264/m.107590 type:complete len:374 (+) Transcript_46264:82-1203(+)
MRSSSNGDVCLVLAVFCTCSVLVEGVQVASGTTTIASQTSSSQVKVWIDAFARSGSSTLLSMVEAAESPNLTVLGLFEPTHSWPERNMQANLMKLLQCDTMDVPALYGLADSHSTTSGESLEALAQECRDSDLFAVKTINVGHNLTADVLPVLEQDEDLQVLYLVRDPRGILASQQVTPGSFDDASTAAMLDVCDVFWHASQVDHPRVMPVLFEELVSSPEQTARAIYRFLGLPEPGEAQLLWIDANFEAELCVSPWRKLAEYVIWMFGGSMSALQAYDDCRPDSEDTVDKWKGSLSTASLQAFESHPSCQGAADFYKWPRGVMHPAAEAKQYSRLVCWLMVLGFLALLCLPGAIFYSWCYKKSVESSVDAIP